MRTKSFVFFLLSLCFLFACGPMETTEAPETESEDSVVETARGIHERVLTLDTHVDIPVNYATEEVDPGVRGGFQVDLPKMEEGGLNTAFFIVFVGQTADQSQLGVYGSHLVEIAVAANRYRVCGQHLQVEPLGFQARAQARHSSSTGA